MVIGCFPVNTNIFKNQWSQRNTKANRVSSWRCRVSASPLSHICFCILTLRHLCVIIPLGLRDCVLVMKLDPSSTCLWRLTLVFVSNSGNSAGQKKPTTVVCNLNFFKWIKIAYAKLDWLSIMNGNQSIVCYTDSQGDSSLSVCSKYNYLKLVCVSVPGSTNTHIRPQCGIFISEGDSRVRGLFKRKWHSRCLSLYDSEPYLWKDEKRQLLSSVWKRTMTVEGLHHPEQFQFLQVFLTNCIHNIMRSPWPLTFDDWNIKKIKLLKRPNWSKT